MINILFFLAILPTILLGLFIYKNDNVEKEPNNLLIKLAVAGVGAIVLTLIISYLLELVYPFFNTELSVNYSPISLAIYIFVGIAFVEEFSKWIFVYLISWNNEAFDHIYDAIVYSVFVSLGFATIENILYVLTAPSLTDAFITAFGRMILSVPGHAFFGIFMGYYLGLAKLTSYNGIKNKSIKYLIYSILIPVVCHFIFDYLLMLNLRYSFLLFIIYVIIVFVLALLKVKKLSNVRTKIFNKPQNQINIDNNINNNCQPMYPNLPSEQKNVKIVEK